MLGQFLKYCYRFLPFKKYIFLSIKKIYIPKQWLYQHLSFKGIFKIRIDKNEFKIYNTGTIIENQLFWKGIDGFEPNSLKIWVKLCKISDVILDIGANTGIYSLIAKCVNPISKVYAFEPVERVYRILEKNFTINNFDACSYKVAISNSDGMGMFYDDDEEHTNSVVLNLDRSDEKNLHKVDTKVTKLDTFIKNTNIQGVALIKMDVETHESEVIEGFKEHLNDFRPTFIIEIIKESVALSLYEQLSGLGYNYFYINEPFGGVDHDVEGAPYQKVESLIDWKWGNYLICNDTIAIQLGLT